MFELMENRIKEKEKNKKLVTEIKRSVPRIQNALQTTVDIAATEARAELYHSQDELKTWMQENPERIEQNRAIFNAILLKYKNISKKISKILD